MVVRDIFHLCKIFYLCTVSTFVRIEETSQIKIYDHTGAAIPIRLLEGIIRKYEKGETFSLRIELVNNDGQEFDMHAFVLTKVSIFQVRKSLKQKLKIFCTSSGTETISS